jgi:probable biosynthetic protein (TIGR04098 family)
LSIYFETTELTYSHQDLGTLNEFGLMCLFGNIHSKALVQGLNSSVEALVDHQGRRIYPAYFNTHLQIPESCLLRQFRAWRNVLLGIELKRFGKCYLDSSYVIKPEGAGIPVAEDFASRQFPILHGNNLFIIDVTEDPAIARELAVPAPQYLAPLPAVTEKPSAIDRAKRLKKGEAIRPDQHYALNSRHTISYPVIPGRDVVAGHAMIFARFCQIMDYAEYCFLVEPADAPIDEARLADLHVLERDIYYFDNAYANDIIDIAVKANMAEQSSAAGQNNTLLETEYKLFRRSNLDLLAVGYARKIMPAD